MAVIQAFATSFLQQCLEGVHNFKAVGGNTFKIALYGASANLDSSATAYTAAGEISATGYTTGGATLTNLGTGSNGTTGYTSFATVTWASPSGTGAGIAASGAMIYNSDAVGYTNPAVCILNFGLVRYPVSDVFTISFPTNNSWNAIIRLNAPAP